MPVLTIARNRMNYSSIQDVLDACDQDGSTTGVVVYGDHNNININSRRVRPEDFDYDSDVSSTSSDGRGGPDRGSGGGSAGHGPDRRSSRSSSRRHGEKRRRTSSPRITRHVVKLSSDRRIRNPIATPVVVDVRLPRGGFAVETVYLERDRMLRCHEITFADGKTRLMATVDGFGRDFAAQLLSLFHRAITDEEGLYLHRVKMMDDPRFAPFAGPLTSRLKKELVMCAAYICFIFGKGPYAFTGSGCFPTDKKPSCADFATCAYRPVEQYSRALSMATTIAMYFNVEDPVHQYTVEDIMSYNIHRGIQKEELSSRLKAHGIFSCYHESAGSIRDVGTTILPLFLFIDSLLPDEFWRGQCAADQVRVTRREMEQIQSNPYIKLGPSGWR